MSDEELLNWSMNQLYRAARTINLLSEDKLISLGCDVTAETILNRLKTTKTGLKIIKQTNPKLLKQKTPKEVEKFIKKFNIFD